MPGSCEPSPTCLLNLFIEKHVNVGHRGKREESLRDENSVQINTSYVTRRFRLMTGNTKLGVERGLDKAHITKVRSELRSKLNERKLK